MKIGLNNKPNFLKHPGVRIKAENGGRGLVNQKRLKGREHDTLGGSHSSSIDLILRNSGGRQLGVANAGIVRSRATVTP